MRWFIKSLKPPAMFWELAPFSYVKTTVEDARAAVLAAVEWPAPCISRPAPAERAVRLVEATRAWAHDLPAQHRPLAILRQFPHVANRLAATAQDAQSFIATVDSFLLDDRGGRQGFSFEVVVELTDLKAYYRQRRSALVTDVWGEHFLAPVRRRS